MPLLWEIPCGLELGIFTTHSFFDCLVAHCGSFVLFYPYIFGGCVRDKVRSRRALLPFFQYSLPDSLQQRAKLVLPTTTGTQHEGAVEVKETWRGRLKASDPARGHCEGGARGGAQWGNRALNPSAQPQLWCLLALGIPAPESGGVCSVPSALH